MHISINERKLLWFALIVGAFFVREALVATVIPFLLAVALAAFIEPLVHALETRVRLPRPLAAGIGMVLLVFSGGIAFLFIFTKVMAELIQMGALLQRYQRVPVDFTTNVIERLNELNEMFAREGLPSEMQRNVLQTVDNVAKASVDLLSQGISVILRTVTQVPFLFVIAVIALLATFFLVKDRDQLTESFLNIVPQRHKNQISDAWQRIIADMVSFFKAQALLVTLTTVIVAVGLNIIGVSYWVTLALLSGILDVIPVLGPGFLFVPWAVGAITVGESGLAVKLLILYAISFSIRQIFQAKILGDSIGVHPLNMLIALYAGIHFFGVQGFIVAPVLVIVAKAIYGVRAEQIKIEEVSVPPLEDPPDRGDPPV